MRKFTKSEIMQLVASGATRESFEHEFEGVFDVTRMRARAKGRVRHRVPIDAVVGFVKTQRVWEEQRVAELTQEQIEEPVIGVFYEKDGTTLLIDGTHRIIRRDRMGYDFVELYIFHEDEICRPEPGWAALPEIDWGDKIVDGKIIKQGE